MIEELLTLAFVGNSLLMCAEDLQHCSVSSKRVLVSALLAVSKQIANTANGSPLEFTLTYGDAVSFLILVATVTSGMTGFADLAFLASLRVIFPGRVGLRGASFFFPGEVDIAASVAEISLVNGLFLVLRYRALSLLRREKSGLIDPVPEPMMLLLPFVWAVAAMEKGGSERVPFIPFLTAGALIGTLFNTLLV